ncbi:hypothetical protein SARC_03365 [Sphaeroforma arctica JP610]|uniref:Glycosyl hydrolase family 13 catalytic domain-containing protein n=1 Tax=Sphaeroforma arctica JP610 TaxID=667725 RepID=A0A0L0G828_9EUKA|nr:hypothetical protein SARC_03365 [Sphaeroforma arctica JP610]KNC84403.1 hypothetical protein SARC_03365 [Sphaeroforma arctica JP610]|eukprot:XP_014158305.1 hypothetical protein SARC_03365 [Sphaeroforma arctica JP610]
MWMPPAQKCSEGRDDTGYAVYDMYDLGEFNQKGTVRTKYGTKREYVDAVAALRKSGIHAYADIVFNHRLGGDCEEITMATPYTNHDRLTPDGDAKEIKAWTHFNFSGRKNTYSAFKWHWWHFNAVDCDSNDYTDDRIFLFEGKLFDDDVDEEYGNYDYLMGCDIDFDHSEVRQELDDWGKWFLNTTSIDGFRLDAVKHIPAKYFPRWLEAMSQYKGEHMFAVGEYWDADITKLHRYIDQTQGRISLFDVPLHFNLSEASISGSKFDMRTIFDGTLVQLFPALACTFVDNHDTQPLQELDSVVLPWFKPLAYALILLRQDGYPCVFEADYNGAEYEDKGEHVHLPSHRYLIEKFMYARKHFSYGAQYDYIDHEDVIGWTSVGSESHPGAMAVLVSNGPGGWKYMEVGTPNTKFVDITGHITDTVTTDAYGWGRWRCEGGSVSVWLELDRTLAEHRPVHLRPHSGTKDTGTLATIMNVFSRSISEFKKYVLKHGASAIKRCANMIERRMLLMLHPNPQTQST